MDRIKRSRWERGIGFLFRGVLRGALAEACGDGARFKSVPHFALCTAHFPRRKCMLPISSFGKDNELVKSQSLLLCYTLEG